VTFWIILAVDG
jgi:hypothetical protein